MHTDPEVPSHSLQIQPPIDVAALMPIHRLVHIVLAKILQSHVRVRPVASDTPQLQAGLPASQEAETSTSCRHAEHAVKHFPHDGNYWEQCSIPLAIVIEAHAQSHTQVKNCSLGSTDLSRPLQHEAIPLRRDVFPEPYPLPLRAQADLVYLSVASKAAVRCMLPCAICCIQAEHCSHASTTVMQVWIAKCGNGCTSPSLQQLQWNLRCKRAHLSCIHVQKGHNRPNLGSESQYAPMANQDI